MIYRPPRWLPGAHLQTIYPALFLKRPLPPLDREIWTAPDDDILALDWLKGEPGKPLLVHFHGLEGSSRSHYARAMLRHLHRIGWNGVVVHFRGCGGVTNRAMRAYHAGDTQEIDWIMHKIAARHGPVYTFGVSLGGNAMLKWLGEQAHRARELVRGAVALSIPFDLQAAGRVLDTGLNRVFYTRHFLTTLKQKALRLRLSPQELSKISTLREFDDKVTAPLHGFENVDDYWNKASSRPWLRHIAVPTLLLQAKNDPFLPPEGLPHPNELNDRVELRLFDQGGHAGFVSGPFPGCLDWLPQTACQWLESRP